MKSWIWSIMGVVTLCGLCLHTSSALAQAPLPASQLNVTVAFGGGLNVSGEDNEVIIPKTVRVKEGGVVHFMVSGFHQIAVYRRGTTTGDITDPGPSSSFIDDEDGRIYIGPSPIPPTPADNFSHDRNRVESVSFARPGRYLVICNVRDHFLEGMHAIVRVLP